LQLNTVLYHQISCSSFQKNVRATADTNCGLYKFKKIDLSKISKRRSPGPLSPS
jgi:hypothetical protein